ncbi:hypothetical protein DFH06DRAFT_1136049 [Mycena polygramma]|nr:hypothetical protein DFH06DRAFT_1136049 [Mycena polygramma]
MDSENTLAMLYGQCHELSLEKIGIIILQCVLVGIILTLRVYAMYNFSKIVLLSVIPAGSVAVILAVWSIAGETWVLATQETGCEYPVSKQRKSPLNRKRTALSVGSYQLVESADFPSSLGMAGAWEAQFLCDVIVFVLTVKRSYREPFIIPGSLLSHMARDGAFRSRRIQMLITENSRSSLLRSSRPREPSKYPDVLSGRCKISSIRPP